MDWPSLTSGEIIASIRFNSSGLTAYSLTAFWACYLICFLSWFCRINMFLQLAWLSLMASVTDIWRFFQPATDKRLKLPAMLIVINMKTTLAAIWILLPTLWAGCAVFITGASLAAWVEGSPAYSLTMKSDFFRDGGRIFPKFPANLSKWSSTLLGELYSGSFIKNQMCILSHGILLG